MMTVMMVMVSDGDSQEDNSEEIMVNESERGSLKITDGTNSLMVDPEVTYDWTFISRCVVISTLRLLW